VPWLDTNVILRFLTLDPRPQALAALRLVERAGRGECTLLVDEVVVAEVIWTLKSFYKRTKPDIVEVLLRFLSTDGIDSRGGVAIEHALVIYDAYNVDFADALLAARAKTSVDSAICSFDRDFDRIAGVVRIEPT
jgi:predicted nucleic acid-binding protein